MDASDPKAPWAGLEPDPLDYEDEVDTAIRFSGLEGWTRRDDTDEDYWSDGCGRVNDQIGLNRYGDLGEFDSTYFSEELTEEFNRAVAADRFDRGIEYVTYSTYPRRSETDEDAQFVSVDLDEREQAAAADWLNTHHPDDSLNWAGLVDDWQSGDPFRHWDTTYGFNTNRKMHDKIAEAVRATSPNTAGSTLDFAVAARNRVNSDYMSATDYLGSDEWKKESWMNRDDED
jgi:hypothetical protein